METVSSDDFIKHDISVDSKVCYVYDIILHKDPCQEKPVIIIATNNELRTFDLTSWQCVSQITTPNTSACLYESDGAARMGPCRDGSQYNIVSVCPLTISTSPHRHVTGVGYYNCISHLGPGRLVAVSPDQPAVHVIDPHGRQLANLTTCHAYGGWYSFTEPVGVVCDGRRVVVTGEGFGNCLGRKGETEDRVVCVEESADSWSVRWMYDVHRMYGSTGTPVISTGGSTVIVPTDGMEGLSGRIVSLSLETGAMVQQVDVSPDCPELGRGTCVYGESLLVGCGYAGVVVEFSLQGKLVCHNVRVVVVAVVVVLS
jgi:hypothetical protein